MKEIKSKYGEVFEKSLTRFSQLGDKDRYKIIKTGMEAANVRKK